jgi:hypothetical protein
MSGSHKFGSRGHPTSRSSILLGPHDVPTKNAVQRLGMVLLRPPVSQRCGPISFALQNQSSFDRD